MRTGIRKVLPWVAAALVLGAIIAGVAVWYLKPKAPFEPKQVVRFNYELPEGQEFSDFYARDFAISRDGSKFVYSTAKGLFLRSMDGFDARFIAGTDESATNPFFSPDSQWIGYVSIADNKLKKISANGRAPISIADITDLRGHLSWGEDDTIVYAPDGGVNIMRISANGGDPELLVEGKGKQPIAPQILPDGKILITAKQPRVRAQSGMARLFTMGRGGEAGDLEQAEEAEETGEI